MTKDAIANRLIELAVKRFAYAGAPLAAGDDLFAKLGIDSFQAMELMTDLEEEFSVEIPDYELQGVTTFAQLADVIESRV